MAVILIVCDLFGEIVELNGPIWGLAQFIIQELCIPSILFGCGYYRLFVYGLINSETLVNLFNLLGQVFQPDVMQGLLRKLFMVIARVIDYHISFPSLPHYTLEPLSIFFSEVL